MSALDLRLLMIVIGLLIIVVLYIWYRGSRNDDIVNIFEEDDENFLDDIPDFDSFDEQESLAVPEDMRDEFQAVSQDLREQAIVKRQEVRKNPAVEGNTVVTKSRNEIIDDSEKIVVLHVVAPAGEPFSGPVIEQMMMELELEHGDMAAYHFNVKLQDQAHSMYCVLNMVKPGTFDPESMDLFMTPGLIFMLRLPGPEDGLKAFNIMYDHACRFAKFCNGEVLDDRRQLMNDDTLTSLKEHVQLFSLRAG